MKLDHNLIDTQIAWCTPLLAAFRYKPGWHFSLRDADSEVMLDVVVDTVDAHDVKLNPRPFTGSYTVPLHLTSGPATDGAKIRFYHWLRHVIREMEHHETDEWFRVGDYRPFDPHRPLYPTSEKVQAALDTLHRERRRLVTVNLFPMSGRGEAHVVRVGHTPPELGEWVYLDCRLRRVADVMSPPTDSGYVAIVVD